MGALVKEVLRKLCVEFGWSYAVFWRAIGCGDQMHLVWEDGYCEQTSAAAPAASGFEAMDILIKESGVLRRSRDGGGVSHLGTQAEDTLRVLVFKLMATQVHVLGHGIVGKAALLGSHEWLIGDSLTDNGSMSKGSAEIYNQNFACIKGSAEIYNQNFACIKTTAVIPVLPHGVVQIGSTKIVHENLEFVTHVKGLFERLRRVPGVLLSGISDNNSCHTIQLHEPVETQMAVKQYAEGVTNKKSVSSPHDDSRNFQHSVHFGSEALNEPCNSSSQLYDQLLTGVPEFTILQNDNISSTTIPLSMQSTAHTGTNSNYNVNCKLVSGHQEADLMFPSSDAMFEDIFTFGSNSQVEYNPSTRVHDQMLTFHEEQLQSMSGIASEFSNSCVPIVDNTNMHQLQPYRCSSFKSLRNSDILSSFTRGQLLDNAKDICKFSSLDNSTKSFWRRSSDSFNAAVPQGIVPLDNSISNRIFTGNLNSSYRNSTSKRDQSGSSAEMKKTNDNCPQALRMQSNQFGHGSSNRSLWRSSQLSSPLQGNRTHQTSSCRENGNACEPQRFYRKHSVESEFLPSMDENVSASSLQPSPGSDLFDLLRLDHYQAQFPSCSSDNVEVQGTTHTHELSIDVSTCITELEHGPVFDALSYEICSSEMFSAGGNDELLDAVVSQFSHGYRNKISEDTSCKTSLTKLSNSSLPASNPSTYKQMNVGTLRLPSVPMKSEPAVSSYVKSSCSMERDEQCIPQSTGDDRSHINIWIEDRKVNSDSCSIVHGKKVVEGGKQNRKRSKPGENPRPRPKDRQMIQDRVKELRDIIPNGAKCSIDVLLEKTIKHMLFLQSVSKHADKLKETGESKILSKEGGLLLKDNFEGGATWAFEVGSQSMTCPIIVEDLNPPRQMLVEMLCEERGHFLELADLVRGLGLTILKGVMEAREDKVWARFAVEANRDVTRMEIFLALVRLLEPSAGINKSLEGFGSSSKRQSIFRSPSVPATGVSDCLW